MDLTFAHYKKAIDTEIETADIYNTYSNNTYKLSKKYLYKFNETNKLWMEIDENVIISDIGRWILTKQTYYQTELNERLININNKIPDPESRDVICKHLVELTKLTRRITAHKYLQNVYKYLIVQISDDKFLQELNHLNPYLLPIKNALVIDLKTKITSPREKHHYFSYECPVEITTKKSNEFEAFISSIMLEQNDHIEYLQKILGYCLSGSLSARSFFIMYGNGKNGKSILLLLMKSVLDSSYKQVMKSVFLDTGKTSGGCETLEIKDARFCVLTETNENEKLNESLIKGLTGGDPLTARGLYKDPVTFQPQCKIFICTNNKPNFRGDDEANVDRIKLIPFNARFVDSPKKPNERQCIIGIDKILIENHLDEFFTWLIEGAYNYFKTEKLTAPKSIQKAENDYVNEQASIKSWMSNNIIECNKEEIKRSAVYDNYIKFCNDNGIIKPESKKKLLEVMIYTYGEPIKTSKGDIIYKNIKFKDENDSDSSNDDTEISMYTTSKPINIIKDEGSSKANQALLKLATERVNERTKRIKDACVVSFSDLDN